jgi:hypothetical protein
MKCINIIHYTAIAIIVNSHNFYASILPEELKNSTGSYSSSVNESPARKIDAIILSHQELTSPIATTLIDLLCGLQDSGGCSKQTSSAKVAAYISGSMDSKFSPVTKNNNLLNELKSPLPSKNKQVSVLQKAFENIDKPDRLAYAAVNIDHIKVPSETISGKKRKVSGGHADLNFYDTKLLNEDVIISQDNHVIGMTAGVSKKTVCAPGYEQTELDILSNAKESTAIAMRPGVNGQSSLHIVQNIFGKLYGQYYDKNNLIVNTSFPLLIVNPDEVEQNGMITLCSLAELHLGTFSVDKKIKLELSQSDLAKIIKKGQVLTPVDKSSIVVDITVPVNKKFNKELPNGLLVPLYAHQKNNNK